nr:tetratricopeptide repeat protein [Armatimonas sp.]
MNESWKITLFGGLRAERGDRADKQIITRFKTQKVASLFAYLAYHLRQAHSREILIEMLWPDSDTLTLRNSLSVALSSLRNQFEPPGVPQGTVLRADRFSVGLNPATVSTDVARFEAAIKAAAKAGSTIESAQHLATAVELYQGPLLPGFYEEWITGEQERLSGLFFDAVGALVSHLESAGDVRAALAHSRHAVAVDPLREEGQQHLIRLLSADGQPGAALRQYKEYERLLEEEMGYEPSPTLRSLFRQIEKASGLAAPATAAPLARKQILPITTSGGPATVTFLMTDIEGSTRLFHGAPEAYSAARERHHALLREVFSRHGGQEVKETGDGFVVAFPTAGGALGCVVAAQKALADEVWAQQIGSLKVRMALHTGDVEYSSENGQYHGLVLHHVSRMLTAAHGGQILISDATAALVPSGGEEGIRFVDLGVYRLRDVPDAKRLFQVEYPEMPQQAFGPLVAEAGHKANLPARFTRFFGRETEIEQLQEMLVSQEVRLVTLSGLGGNGKTRLSLEVAERLAEPFAGAVYFVPLADVSDHDFIPGVVLDRLGVPRSAQQEPLEQAVEALAKKPTLLVLDNFEQIAEGGAQVVQALLSRVPSLKLLITSRQLLGLSAEREFVLSPLPVPGTHESPEQLSLYESVQLFIDRAQQVMPHFQVNNANAAAVAALVAGLEGIPLAIELSAARAQVLTPAQMLAQLSHRFDFLSSRKRDTSERHRTLRGAIDWSYQLLSPELQTFFRRLCVFRGGWAVEAAEAVCEEPLALDYVEQLRECSLVLANENEAAATVEIRYRMLETIRQYAAERLSASDADEVVRVGERHVSWCLALVEEAQPQLTGPEQGAWLNRLESEHDNLRAALDTCAVRAMGVVGAGDGAQAALVSRAALAGLRLVGSLGRFWQIRGHLSEGREQVSRALQACQAAASAVSAGAAGDTHAYTTADASGDAAMLKKATAEALGAGGFLASLQGDYAAAQSLFKESLSFFREVDDKRSIAGTLNSLGNVARYEGDYAAARALIEESLSFFREVGNKVGVATTLNSLGSVASKEGDYAAARGLLRESLSLYREVGNKVGVALVLNSLGYVASKEGDYAAARALYEESLSFFREVGDKRGVAEGFEGVATALRNMGEVRRAATLLAAAGALRESIGLPLTGIKQVEYDTEVAKARAQMGEEPFAAAWAQGRTLSWEQALALALRH